MAVIPPISDAIDWVSDEIRKGLDDLGDKFRAERRRRMLLLLAFAAGASWLLFRGSR